MKKELLFLAVLILLISGIHGLPSLIMAKNLGGLYTPITLGQSPFARDEAYAYAPEVNYILKGHVTLGEAYVKEYKDYPTPFRGETFPAVVLAFLSIISGSIEESFVISDFIFPPLIFLLLYIVAKNFIKDWFFAGVIAFIATVSRDFIAVIPYPHETWQLLTFSEGQSAALYLSRAFHPQITYPVFLLYIISVLALLKDPKNKFKILTTGVALGILFYTYIFYWTYAVFFTFLLFCYLLLTKRFTQAKSIFASGLLALIIGINYFANILHFYSLELSKDFVKKSSLPELPLPATLVRYLAITGLFFVSFKRRNLIVISFTVLLLAGVLIAPVSKFFLGQDLETFHYLRRALMPLATIAFFAIIYQIVKTNKAAVRIFAAALFFVFFAAALNMQLISTKIIQKAHITNSDQRAVFNWFSKNTSGETSIGSLDTDFNLLIPVYTNNFTYFPTTDRTVMTTGEGVTRFVTLANLLGIEKAEQKKMLVKNLSYMFIYQAYNQEHALDPNTQVSLDAQKQIDKYYKNIDNLPSSGELDYLVLTPKEQGKSNPDVSRLEAITSINGYIIFKLKNK